MARDDVESRVRDHEARITRLEKWLQSGSPPASAKAGRSLPTVLAGLRSKGFFSGPKTGAETHGEVIKTYHCEKNRVDMALLRIADAGELRKASKTVDGRKLRAYVW